MTVHKFVSSQPPQIFPKAMAWTRRMRWQHVGLSILLVVVAVVFSALIPPFQSPDESDHIKRAYWLGKGKILLESPPGQASGGMIDSGLAAYIQAFSALPHNTDRKLSADEIQAARAIRWSHAKEYSAAPGTGYYFPVIYLPQMLGLYWGEASDLSVAESYSLARYFAALTVALLLALAFWCYRPTPLVYAVLLTPMTLFQISSASLDGVATALAVLMISLYLKIMKQRERAHVGLFYGLAIGVGLLATSRVHLLPSLGLLAAAPFFMQRRRLLVGSALVVVAVLSWIALAAKTTVDTRVVMGATTGQIAVHYLTKPLELWGVLARTAQDANLLNFYKESFFGVLGWLDLSLDQGAYRFYTQMTIFIGLLSISIRAIKAEWQSRLTLLLCALGAVFLVFFALLITWTPHPATVVQGVQGRYFLIPIIVLAYAMGAESPQSRLAKLGRMAAWCGVAWLTWYSLALTPRLLVERYYVQPHQSGSQGR